MVLSLRTLLNFHGGLPDSIREQIGSVNEYHDSFIEYSKSVHVSDPDIWLPCFLVGLKFEIYREVIQKEPKSLIEAWLFARCSELRIEDQKEEEQANSEANYGKSEDQESDSSTTNSDHATHQATLQNTAPEITNSTIQQSDPTNIHQQLENTKIQKSLDPFNNNQISNQTQEDAEHLSDTGSRGVVPPWMSESRFEEAEKAASTVSTRDRNDEDGRAVGGAPPPPTMLAAATILGGGDMRGGSGAEGGAFAKRERKVQGAPLAMENTHVVIAVISDFRRALQIVAKPPPLMAAAFPWDHDSEIRKGKKQDKVAADVDLVIDGAIIEGAHYNHLAS